VPHRVLAKHCPLHCSIPGSFGLHSAVPTQARGRASLPRISYPHLWTSGPCPGKSAKNYRPTCWHVGGAHFLLLRKCQREYVAHAIRRKCAGLVFHPDDQKVLSNLDPRFENLEVCDWAVLGRRGKGDLVIPAQLGETLRTPSSRNVDRKVAIWFHFGAVQIRKPHEIYHENDLFRLPCSVAIGPGRIPDKVLRSPWSDAQFEFLHLLSSDFYLEEDEARPDRSSEITYRLIRTRKIEPLVACCVYRSVLQTVESLRAGRYSIHIILSSGAMEADQEIRLQMLSWMSVGMIYPQKQSRICCDILSPPRPKTGIDIIASWTGFRLASACSNHIYPISCLWFRRLPCV
jgi:hypothetical protein